MATGTRRYNTRTENIPAKLKPSPEHGDVVDVILLWEQMPQTLSQLPICHLLPTHPNSDSLGEAVTVILGNLKGETRIVMEVAGDRVFTCEYSSGKKLKTSHLIEHSIHSLVLCLPKKARK